MGKGTIPFELLFCFHFCDTIYLSGSLPHQKWTPWIPDSCSLFPVPYPSLVAQSFPESLQSPSVREGSRTTTQRGSWRPLSQLSSKSTIKEKCRGPERARDLPKMTQEVNGRVRLLLEMRDSWVCLNFARTRREQDTLGTQCARPCLALSILIPRRPMSPFLWQTSASWFS